jgi:hypothetical protein
VPPGCLRTGPPSDAGTFASREEPYKPSERSAADNFRIGNVDRRIDDAFDEPPEPRTS